MIDFRGDIKATARKKFIISKVVLRAMDPSLLAHDLVASGLESPFSQYYVNSVKSFDGKDSTIDPSVLVKTWNVGLETARRTI